MALITLLMIADDFTGALDTGVQLAGRGVRTKVVTGLTGSLGSIDFVDALVIDTETRHLPPDQAGRVVGDAVRWAVAHDIPHIYKKTDSALRGNIGAELNAMLEASGETVLPFLPAYPQIDRCTVGGVHYIGTQPVAESVFGCDPFEPVRHSHVADLIAEQSDTPVYCISTGGPAPDGNGIHVYDARSVSELETIGQALAQARQLHICAGCAGFGAVLPQLLNVKLTKDVIRPQLDPRLLVVCGSVNPITLAQLDVAEQAGFARTRLQPHQKLKPGYWQSGEGQANLEQIETMLATNAHCILDSNDPGGNQLTADYAAQFGYDLETVRVRIANSLGHLVEQLFQSPSLGTLLVTGGDTLLQVMNCVGIHELEPVCEVQNGVVLARFDHHGCTRYVITKSGGFGHKDLLTELADWIAATDPIHTF